MREQIERFLKPAKGAAFFRKLLTPFIAGGVFVERMGGDADTIAAMAGSIYGAAQGEQALPPRWLAALEDCAELRELARELAPAPAWMTSED